MRESPRLYVHCLGALSSLRSVGDAVPGFDLYAERALVMAGSRDLVCVPGTVAGDYLTFLNELGVGPAPRHVLALGEEERGDAPARSLATRLLDDPLLPGWVGRRVPPGATLELHPYAATRETFALAAILEAEGTRVRVLGGDPAINARADQKHVMREKAIQLGVPVAPGETVELSFPGGRRRRDLEPVRAAIQRQLRWTGQVIVRGSSGASGQSTFIVGRGGDDTEGVVRRLGGRADNRVYLVEAMVDVTVSPNLQLRIEPDGAITSLGVTDQRWGRRLVHAGNVYPSTARLVDVMDGWAHTLAGSLRDDGYAGDVGFDFVEHLDPDTGKPRAFLAEVNPRVNGASYPLALLKRLNAVRALSGESPIEAFASGMLATRAREFSSLRDTLGDHLFTHPTGAGLVPYATGCLAYGKVAAVAFAPTRPEALRRLADAQTALETTWVVPSCA